MDEYVYPGERIFTGQHAAAPENGVERMWRVREAFFSISDCPVSRFQIGNFCEGFIVGYQGEFFGCGV